MECINNSPMLLVDDVIVELRRLSSLCHVMGQFQDYHDTVNTETVGDTMCLIRDILDHQVKALDAIQWRKEKAVGA